MMPMITVRIRESMKKASNRIQKPTYFGSRDITVSAMVTPPVHGSPTFVTEATIAL